MSLLEDLGAQLRATADELPTGLVSVAIDRLRTATDLLFWVRQNSVDPIGVPQLSSATEHAEQAAYALRVAQDAVAGYLSVLGLTHDAGRATEGAPRTTGRPVEPTPAATDARPPTALRRWWQARVGELTGADAEPGAGRRPTPGPAEDDGPGVTGPGGARGGHRPATTGSGDLLHRLAAAVAAGDRAALHRELAAAPAPVGLGLSAATAPVLHRLCGDLLGHPPRPDDLPKLRDATAGRVRDLLPGLPLSMLDTLLARVCRVPTGGPTQAAAGRAGDTPTPGSAAARGAAAPAHPADPAVAGGVLAGVLLARLGRDPGDLQRDPDPAERGPGAPQRDPRTPEPDPDPAERGPGAPQRDPRTPEPDPDARGRPTTGWAGGRDA